MNQEIRGCDGSMAPTRSSDNELLPSLLHGSGMTSMAGASGGRLMSPPAVGRVPSAKAAEATSMVHIVELLGTWGSQRSIARHLPPASGISLTTD